MTEHFKLDNQLCFSLYNAQRQVNRYYSNKVFKKYNLTYPQFLVLKTLWESSPVNVKKLVTELSLDTGTISPLLKRMENNGLIKRVRSELDQREVFIHLTDKSKEMQTELENASHVLKEASQLTNKEYDEFGKLLTKLIHSLKTED